MATATFRKNLPSELSPDQDGADPRASDPSGSKVDSYQMVPMGGVRTFNVKTTGQVRVEIFSTLGAEISVGGGGPGKFFTISGNVPETQFTIHARGEGRTTIFALDEKRTILDRMMVSIKNERPLTYNLHRLGDSKRETTRNLPDLMNVLKTVERTYLLQANVRLRLVKANDMLRIKQNLGDPIEVNEPRLISALLRANLREVLKQTLSEGGFLGEDLNLVSTWRLQQGSDSLAGFTPDLGRICLCEVKKDPNVEAMTYTHEMGHALGLRHGGHFPEELMNGIGRDSFRMIQPDIDTVNPSGTKPLPQR